MALLLKGTAFITGAASGNVFPTTFTSKQTINQSPFREHHKKKYTDFPQESVNTQPTPSLDTASPS